MIIKTENNEIKKLTADMILEKIIDGIGEDFTLDRGVQAVKKSYIIYDALVDLGAIEVIETTLDKIIEISVKEILI